MGTDQYLHHQRTSDCYEGRYLVIKIDIVVVLEKIKYS